MVDHSTHGLLQNKPFKIALGLTLILVGVFWFGSRYPDLDQKALMAGDTQFSAIGFDLLINMPPQPSLFQEIGVNAINWVFTNWKGMTFGLLAGALILTMLPHLQRLHFKSRLANSFLGLLVGAPLGVCVNCATPVSQGAIVGGARPETALAMMVSSPTMNVLVLTMVLSLFPLHIAVTKIGLTLVFILVLVPLIVRMFPAKTQQIAIGDVPRSAPLSRLLQPPSPRTALQQGWSGSSIFVLSEALRNLLYLVAVTVPLMLLAGVLGAAVVTVLPFDTLAEILPRDGAIVVLRAMLLLAIFALILPSPMMFDVIVAAALFNAGLSAGYVMVMLFGLGIFSVYPFLLIWRQLSRQIALAMIASLSALGVAGGAFVHVYHPQYAEAQDTVIRAQLAQVDAPVEREYFTRPLPDRPARALVAELQANQVSAEMLFAADGLSIEQAPYDPSAVVRAQHQFTRIEGAEIGLTEGFGQTFERFSNPMVQVRAVAAGDIHNDGWPDLVFGSERGFGVYANSQNGHFERQEVILPEAENWTIGAVALIDMTNDGWLDLVFSTLQAGVWMVANSDGMFEADGLVNLPNTEAAVMPTVLAFDDTNHDGRLDLFIGNAGYGNNGREASPPSSQDVLLISSDTGYDRIDLDGVVAETLTALFVDLDEDGSRDLFVGNDFGPGDIIYRNDGQGAMHLMSEPTDVLPLSGRTTMAMTSADIDNDLIPEIFVGQRAWERNSVASMEPAEVCAELLDDAARSACLRHYQGVDIRTVAHRRGNLDQCAQWPVPGMEADCVALQAYAALDTRNVSLDYCAPFSPGWPLLHAACETLAGPVTPPTAAQIDSQLPSVDRRNLLFARDEAGAWRDVAGALGVVNGGWVWNARFADLNHDAFQDLFIVTGFPTVDIRHPSYFYRNIEGGGFENVTREVGLNSNLDIASFAYVDFDLDGDLDIVVPPLVGPVSMLRNDGPIGNALSISLRDERGNRFAVGARITITTPDGTSQMREIVASGGYMSHDELIAHFGLGDQPLAQGVVVTWPDGEVSEVAIPLEAGARYTITRRRLVE
ncbi:FG-GAP-like repeat-containing protein [Rhodobacteraceae bacterium N5(2021)]|uniref:FG-GAP-like repeat-containing protein n=1 Tax=Gymnodinialimonas phycosphaerae TaxID=2841589 RepID=A0A975TX54_9RHOB|nr:FG-GAP-like repeat-containing protein [Gymnodinialimonas phycosphaerae]MBY4892157.1 FG-GAP-like repeat-containing protein [Gymnodinialimonas phycosphaerae]